MLRLFLSASLENVSHEGGPGGPPFLFRDGTGIGMLHAVPSACRAVCATTDKKISAKPHVAAFWRKPHSSIYERFRRSPERRYGRGWTFAEISQAVTVIANRMGFGRVESNPS